MIKHAKIKMNKKRIDESGIGQINADNELIIKYKDLTKDQDSHINIVKLFSNYDVEGEMWLFKIPYSKIFIKNNKRKYKFSDLGITNTSSDFSWKTILMNCTTPELEHIYNSLKLYIDRKYNSIDGKNLDQFHCRQISWIMSLCFAIISERKVNKKHHKWIVDKISVIAASLAALAAVAAIITDILISKK